jgi:hypothetical protein
LPRVLAMATVPTSPRRSATSSSAKEMRITFQVGFTFLDLQEGHMGRLPMALNLFLQSRHS